MSIYGLPTDPLIHILEYVDEPVTTIFVSKRFKHLTESYVVSNLEKMAAVKRRFMPRHLFITLESLKYWGPKRLKLSQWDFPKTDNMDSFLFVESPDTPEARMLRRVQYTMAPAAECVGLPKPTLSTFASTASEIARREPILDAALITLYRALELPIGYIRPHLDGANNREKANQIIRWLHEHRDDSAFRWMHDNQDDFAFIPTIVIPPGEHQLLPPEIALFAELVDLTVKGCHLKELPKELALLSNLEKIDADDNELTSLPDTFYQLENLRELFLTHNRFSKVPPVLYQLKRLEKLDLDRNPLGIFPEQLCDLTHLVNLSTPALGSVPAKINQLIQLDELYINEGNLQELPLTFGTLPRLRILTIKESELAKFPHPITQITTLCRLNLSANKLETLPDAIGQLTNLTILNVGGNHLSALPSSMRNMRNLTTLIAYANQFKEFPPVISQLHQLTYIDFYDNKLTTLDSRLAAAWRNARKLNFEENPFETLPEEFRAMPNFHLEGEVTDNDNDWGEPMEQNNIPPQAD